jgi:DNA-binding response OmpR family regulator
MKILLIEDDDASSALLARSLTSQHHVVDVVTDGEVGWTYASTFDYSLIILDIMLPKLDGISLCKKLRAEGYTVPILLLTSQNQTTAKIQGLDAGADDYVVKPFDIAELIARVRALLRRGSPNPLPLLSWGDLVLNPSSCDVTYNGRLLTLTTKEYDLLELLLRDSSHVFSSNEIIDHLWSSDDFPAEATVRSHLRRLRNKLQSVGAPHDLIGTIHGRGYYLRSAHPPEEMMAFDSTDPSRTQSEQYFDFLQETWLTTKPQCLEQIEILTGTIDRLLAGTCTYSEQQQAHQIAHKLVGTLGVFSLFPAMELARELEHCLELDSLLPPIAASALPDLSSHLLAALTAPLPRSPVHSEGNPDHQPLLLLVELDPDLDRALPAIAHRKNVAVDRLSIPEATDRYLNSHPAKSSQSSLPTLVLVQLFADRDIHNTPLLDFIHNIHQHYPTWVLLVLGEADSFQARLAVVRHGGKFLAIAGLTAEQIFTTTLSLSAKAHSTIKVMVLNDDLAWLRTLPQSLETWGLHVTTLAEPEQFWLVFQSIQPDALVLDIKPEINGLEICQVLRSDPHWQHLPILFITASPDHQTQQEAFRLGADDYLHKSVMDSELAQRIRYRLARIQSLPAAT